MGKDAEKVVKIAPQAMRIFEFMILDNEAIEAKTVDCDTCPVSMLCQAGEGGTGRICAEACRSTGVPVDSDSYQDAKIIYLLDCAKHTFNFEKELKPCNLCDARIIQHEVRDPAPTPTVYLIRTKHSKVTIEERKEAFAKGETVWREHYKAKGKTVAP